MSSPGEIGILNALAISTQPQSQPGGVGGSVTFSNAASGSAPFSYTWRKNGTPIGGGTGQTLTLINLQTNDAGNYDVVVANWVGATTSQVAVLTINMPIL